MIKEIERPKINFKFIINGNDKFYFDKKNNEYFLINNNNNNIYYFNLIGNIHRIGKPAIEYFDGSKEWVINGKIHRIDGPAYIQGNYIQFWINNVGYFRDKYYKFADKTNHLICKNCNKFCKQECFL